MNRIIVIGGESVPMPCEYCGNLEELRPYGQNGALICFDCGMKPENITITESTFDKIHSGEHEKPSKEQNN
jgi:hypothetical protein